MAPERLIVEVERVLAEIATDRRIQLNGREQRQLARELVDDMLGLGPLEPLLADDSITDIMVNGPNRVFIERGGKMVLSGVTFRDATHVANVSQRIASSIGRRIDESSPMVDARLKDGSRVNIVFQPLALDGPYLSIRKFSRRKIDFQKLIEYGSLTLAVARVLEIAGRARLNVIISGGTGSGKTTLMNAMSRMIHESERVLTVEDAAELQLQQPHVVRLETRPASLEGRGEISQRDLVRNALRMRPDRIIIGEVRGAEAFDMLQAMNTGHDGSMSTVHANTTRDALTRIENMVQMGNMGLPSRAIRTQIVGAIDLIVQVARQRDGTRRITQGHRCRRARGRCRDPQRRVPARARWREYRGQADRPLRRQPVTPELLVPAQLFRSGKAVERGSGGCGAMTRPVIWCSVIWCSVIRCSVI